MQAKKRLDHPSISTSRTVNNIYLSKQRVKVRFGDIVYCLTRPSLLYFVHFNFKPLFAKSKFPSKEDDLLLVGFTYRINQLAEMKEKSGVSVTTLNKTKAILQRGNKTLQKPKLINICSQIHHI